VESADRREAFPDEIRLGLGPEDVICAEKQISACAIREKSKAERSLWRGSRKPSYGTRIRKAKSWRPNTAKRSSFIRSNAFKTIKAVSEMKKLVFRCDKDDQGVKVMMIRLFEKESCAPWQ
jgi:hypothetical protein